MNTVQKIFDILNFEFSGNISFTDFDGVYVRYDGKDAVISNCTTSYLTRGLTLLAKNICNGRGSFELKETTPLKSRGLHLELSRNNVLRVSAIKTFLDYMACLGINALYLYMEDVYRLEGYPYFGYMRGAYSKEELKEIDDYAFDLGIEVIPEIQTLGHMEQYLKWPAAAPVKCNSSVLLCGEEPTYALIEAMIATMRECFRTKRIHVGCDEAFELQLGNYYRKNGPQDTLSVMLTHIGRVVELCKKYAFSPMLYSDMYFHHCSPTGGYYHTDVEFTEEIRKLVPDAELVYWDYGHTQEQEYQERIEKHRELDRNVVLCTAIWAWADLLPRYQFTLAGMVPCVKAAIKSGITDIYATTWGNDGSESSRMFELFGLPLFSELCFRGEDFREEDFYDLSKFLFGVDKAFFDAVGELAEPHTHSADYGLDDTFYGKSLFYTDPLYNLTGAISVYGQMKPRYDAAAQKLRGSIHCPRWKPFEDHAVQIYEILALKAEMISNIRRAYESQDRDYMRYLADSLIPELKDRYARLLPQWQEQWLSTSKPFGWEIINGRLGFVMARLDYAVERITAWLDGAILTIEELDEPYLEDSKSARGWSFMPLVSTSVNV